VPPRRLSDHFSDAAALRLAAETIRVTGKPGGPVQCHRDGAPLAPAGRVRPLKLTPGSCRVQVPSGGWRPASVTPAPAPASIMFTEVQVQVPGPPPPPAGLLDPTRPGSALGHRHGDGPCSKSGRQLDSSFPARLHVDVFKFTSHSDGLWPDGFIPGPAARAAEAAAAAARGRRRLRRQ
jgi:hypothetical protein